MLQKTLQYKRFTARSPVPMQMLSKKNNNFPDVPLKKLGVQNDRADTKIVLRDLGGNI